MENRSVCFESLAFLAFAWLNRAVKIVEALAKNAAAEQMEFLVIGGNAVVAYGYPRRTVDVDLLVRENDRQKWHELILSLDYYPHHIQGAFLMFNPKGEDRTGIDLMLVNDRTFAKLLDKTAVVKLGGAEVRIPSLRNLIALKLHALRHGDPYRYSRDFVDVIELLQHNQVDLAAPDYVEILSRYATPAIVDEIRTRYAGPRPADPG